MKKLITLFIGTFILVRNYEWFQDTILNMVHYASNSMANATTASEKAMILICVMFFTVVIIRSFDND